MTLEQVAAAHEIVRRFHVQAAGRAKNEVDKHMHSRMASEIEAQRYYIAHAMHNLTSYMRFAAEDIDKT